MFKKLFSSRSAYRTYACARTAVDAGISVDNVLAISLGNSANGALVGTSAASDAII
jgi:hypothetical protein